MLTKGDFYYGALLTNLIRENFAPAIIESAEERRIYSLSSDQGDYIVYAKYLGSRSGNVWNFKFSSKDLVEVQNYFRQAQENKQILLLAFICGEKELRNSEIAYVKYQEFQKIISNDYQDQYFKILAKINSKYFHLYGTFVNPEDGIKILRNEKKRLQEINEES